MRKSQIRKNPKLRKALVDSIENGAIDKLKEVDGGSNLLLKHINKLLAEWKAEFIKDYDKIMPEMEAYFNEKKKQNGSAYFIPKSPNEMFEKFIHEIRNRDSLHLSLERKDFISFSNVVKQELDNSLSNDETDKRKEPGQDKIKRVATRIKGDTRSKDDTYSRNDIEFALKLFADNYQHANYYSEIHEIIKMSVGCPKSLKQDKAYKRMVDWFHAYEKETGVSLK